MSRVGPVAILFLAALAAACEADPPLPDWSSEGAEGRSASLHGGAAWPPNTQNQIGPELVMSAPEMRSTLPLCSQTTPTITSDSVGPLRVGMILRDVLHACGEIYRGWDWGYEGVPEPVVAVRLGEAVVIAPLPDTTADAAILSLKAMAARTAEGVGAGSTFAELRKVYGGGGRLEEGECLLVASFEARPRWSFPLDIPDEAGLECDDLPEIASRDQLDRVPAETIVRYVIVLSEGPNAPRIYDGRM